MGLTSSAQNLFNNECTKISSELHRLEGKTRPRNRAAILNEIYGKSLCLKYIKEAYNTQRLFSLSNGNYVCNPLETGFMGLLIPDFMKQKIESTLIPLLLHFLKVQAKQKSLEKDGSILSVDTLRIVTRNEFKTFNPELRIGTSIFTDELFAVLGSFVKHSKENHGIRIVSKSIRNSVWEKYEHICYACECELHNDDFEMAHVSSTAGGGLTIIPNLRPCCFKCNRSMGEMNLYEYIIRNKLKGKEKIPEDQIQLWEGIILLTDYVAARKPEIVKYQLIQRLRIITEFIAIDWR
jgi:hypothetical protein